MLDQRNDAHRVRRDGVDNRPCAVITGKYAEIDGLRADVGVVCLVEILGREPDEKLGDRSEPRYLVLAQLPARTRTRSQPAASGST